MPESLQSPSGFQMLAARYQLHPMPVLASRELVDVRHPLGEPKRFLQLQLPDGVTYRTGDHLAVLPRNPASLVQRVLDRFGLAPTEVIELASGRRGLPIGIPVSVLELLTGFVELRFPPSAIGVQVLADHTPEGHEKSALEDLATLEREAFRQQVTHKHLSFLDLLEQFPSCELPFDRYLELVRPLRPRSYSISSSPLAQPDAVDLMVSLLDENHRAGIGTFRGVASEYLNQMQAGGTVYAKVVPCHEPFRLPPDRQTPIILISAGTGLAPFRGAIADRLVEPGGTVLCYFGCRHPDVDFLHRAELEEAHRIGAISLRPVFSRAPVDGARYVQHRIATEGDELWDLLQVGAHVRVCGDGRFMAPDVRSAFRDIHQRHTGGSTAEAEAWLHEMIQAGRYVEDVWAG